MKKETVVIHGQSVGLVERKCKGCERTFKVMLKSKHRYHSFECEEADGGTKRPFNFYLGTEGAPVLPKSGIIEPEE